MADIRANGVPDELLEDIAVKCARMGRLSIREATMQAFALWLGREIPTQTKQDFNDQEIDHETRVMIDLFLTARTVQDQVWREMLQSIKNQLAHVAKAAHNEQRKRELNGNAEQRDVSLGADGGRINESAREHPPKAAADSRHRGKK